MTGAWATTEITASYLFQQQAMNRKDNRTRGKRPSEGEDNLVLTSVLQILLEQAGVCGVYQNCQITETFCPFFRKASLVTSRGAEVWKVPGLTESYPSPSQHPSQPS